MAVMTSANIRTPCVHNNSIKAHEVLIFQAMMSFVARIDFLLADARMANRLQRAVNEPPDVGHGGTASIHDTCKSICVEPQLEDGVQAEFVLRDNVTDHHVDYGGQLRLAPPEKHGEIHQPVGVR